MHKFFKSLRFLLESDSRFLPTLHNFSLEKVLCTFKKILFFFLNRKNMSPFSLLFSYVHGYLGGKNVDQKPFSSPFIQHILDSFAYIAAFPLPIRDVGLFFMEMKSQTTISRRAARTSFLGARKYNFRQAKKHC